jgi:hypothetical protein
MGGLGNDNLSAVLSPPPGIFIEISAIVACREAAGRMIARAASGLTLHGNRT